MSFQAGAVAGPRGDPSPMVIPQAVWRADALAAADEPTISTGLPALDAVLPGGGWPVGALTELLQARPHQAVWRLLAPGLARALALQAGPVLLVAPPQPVCVPGLAGRGLPAHRWLWVQADAPAARLWAAEQALRCAEVAAVLAWLPQAAPADLRRLQLVAQRHRQLLFVLRPLSAREQASPARLRLALEEGEGPARALRVQVLKRRGPPLVSPVLLPPQHGLLARLLQARAEASHREEPGPLRPKPRDEQADGLDRAATRLAG
jgi:protein ImuA